MATFLGRFSEWLEEHTAASDELAVHFGSIVSAFSNSWPPAGRTNLESIYQLLYSINRFPDVALSPIINSEIPQRSRATELLEYHLKHFIQRTYGTVLAPKVAYLHPLLPLFRHLRTTVVTTNYDSCIETLCRDTEFSLLDGFDGEGNFVGWPETQAGAEQLVYSKMHGSANWYYSDKSTVHKFKASADEAQGGVLLAARPLVPERALVYPGFGKETAQGIFDSARTVALRALSSADVCVVAGYSFVDPHIVALFGEATASRVSPLRVLLVDPNGAALGAWLTRTFQTSIEFEWTEGESGYFGTALSTGWLADRVLSSRRYGVRHPISGTVSRSQQRRDVVLHQIPYRGRISGILGSPSGESVYFTVSESGLLVRASRNLRTTEIVASGLNRPRGLCWMDDQARALIVVENASNTEHSIEGLGALAVIELSKGDLTRPRLQAGSSSGFDIALSWPNEIARIGDRVFITCARRMMTVELDKWQVAGTFAPPHAFNVCSVSPLADGRFFILDQGVAESYGTGQLLITDERFSSAHPIFRVAAYSWSVRTDASNRQLMMIFANPAGGALAVVNLEAASVEWRAQLPHGAHSMTVQSDAVLIGSRDGIYELRGVSAWKSIHP